MKKSTLLLFLLVVFSLVAAACAAEEVAEPAPEEVPEEPEEPPAELARDEAPYSVDFDWGTFELHPDIAAKLEAGDPLNFILSIEGTGIPIFGAAMAAGWERGLEYANEFHPVQGRVVGPIDTDVPAQVAEMESLLDAGEVDCFSFEAHEPGPYVDVIDRAMEMGVPVIGVNADSPDSKRIAFYALDEFLAGKLAGEIVADWTQENDVDIQQAALMTGSVEGPWAQNRMRGFMEGIEENLPDVEFVNSPDTVDSQGFDFADVYARAEAFITGNPDVDLIFHTDQGIEMVGQVIEDMGLVGETYGAGFNVSPAIVDSIRTGSVIVTIGQGFSNQAEAGAVACADFLFQGEFDTGHVVLDPIPVTEDNVDERDWFDPANQ